MAAALRPSNSFRHDSDGLMHICIYAGTNLTHFFFLAKFPRARLAHRANSNFIKQRRGRQEVTSSLLSAQHREVLDGGLCHHRQNRIIQLFSAIIFRREWDRRSKDVAWHLIKSSGGAWLSLNRLYNTAETLHQAVIATYSLAEMVPIAQKDGSSYQSWSAYWN